MTDLWDQLFGSGSKSVRRRVVLRPTVDSDGNPIIETVDGESISLSPDGSIDSTKVIPDRFYHCGCNAENRMGGRCSEPECGRVSCVRCFQRCQHCAKPLCLEHTVFLRDEKDGGISLCRRCHESLRRKHIVRSVLRPFIEFEEREK